jgi:pimeloyl-ACP methyl ester carboxylesterase
MVEGRRHEIVSGDGTRIGLLTAGQGPQLLLVHGGMGCIEAWDPMWGKLTSHWQVTATSGDTAPYSLDREYQDVAAVAASMAAAGPVDVFGHSFGATCVLGAAAGGAPVRRIALYEPGGPQTVPPEWLDRVQAMLAQGRVGRAMMSFLTEIIGLTQERVRELRDTPPLYNALAIMAATLPREAPALASADLPRLAAAVRVPALLMLGSQTPAWAGDITNELLAALPDSKLAMLDGQGHEATDRAPGMITSLLAEFFG